MTTERAGLDQREQELAHGMLQSMAEEFVADGTLRTAIWQEIFTRTWRHPYVPYYYPALNVPPVSGDNPERRSEWLAAVYSNRTLVTKVVQVPSRPGRTPASYPMWTSSSTLPSLMLMMLEALEIADGHRVLEIGTGSGYNTALLCERLGDAQIVTVDIDPELVEVARDRLAANGYTPTLAATDGAAGYPPHAPYDRIIATCSVEAIPPAWVDQAAPGGVILTDVRGLLGGTVALLRADGHGEARGRFLPGDASFMPLRHNLEIPPLQSRTRLANDAVESTSTVDPSLLRDDATFRFVTQWHLPDVGWKYIYADDGATGIQLDTPDGSGAQAWFTPESNGFAIRQAGPRQLWAEVERAHEFWNNAGRPGHEQFGITASRHEQHIWFQHPDSEHRWPIRTGCGASRATTIDAATRRPRYTGVSGSAPT